MCVNMHVYIQYIHIWSIRNLWPLIPPLPLISNYNPAAGSCSAPSGFLPFFGRVRCAVVALENIDSTLTAKILFICLPGYACVWEWDWECESERPWKDSQLCFSQLSSSCSWCIFCLVSCTSSTFRTRWSTSCMLGKVGSGVGICVFYGQDDVLRILISVLKISILWQKNGSACILKDRFLVMR